MISTVSIRKTFLRMQGRSKRKKNRHCTAFFPAQCLFFQIIFVLLLFYSDFLKRLFLYPSASYYTPLPWLVPREGAHSNGTDQKSAEIAHPSYNSPLTNRVWGRIKAASGRFILPIIRLTASSAIWEGDQLQ